VNAVIDTVSSHIGGTCAIHRTMRGT
jgi:hypothetical protein